MNLLNNTAKKEIIKYIENNFNKIKVTPGKCRMNFRCHLNTVNDAINNKDDKIALCIYIEDNQPIIHFINYTDKKYIDNTLGYWITKVDVYFIKYIKKQDFDKIEAIFLKYRKELRSKLKKITYLLSDYNC